MLLIKLFLLRFLMGYISYYIYKTIIVLFVRISLINFYEKCFDLKFCLMHVLCSTINLKMSFYLYFPFNISPSLIYFQIHSFVIFCDYFCFRSFWHKWWWWPCWNQRWTLISKYKYIKKPIPCVIARNVLNLKIGLSHGELVKARK